MFCRRFGEENRLGTVLCQRPIHASVRYGRQDYEDGCGLHTAMLTEFHAASRSAPQRSPGLFPAPADERRAY